MLTTHRSYRTIIAIVLAGALVAPAASVADDHWAYSTPTEARQDLRSPDTRDAALGLGTWSAPEVTVVRLPQPAPVAERGIDWGDAGIGAGTLFGVMLVGLGGAVAIVHRRRATPAA